MENKRRDDARNRLKKLARDERAMRREVEQRATKDSEVAAEAERKAAFLAKINEGIRGLEAKIAECNENKDANLTLILELQTRYSILYTLTDKVDSNFKRSISHVQGQVVQSGP